MISTGSANVTDHANNRPCKGIAHTSKNIYQLKDARENDETKMLGKSLTTGLSNHAQVALAYFLTEKNGNFVSHV